MDMINKKKREIFTDTEASTYKKLEKSIRKRFLMSKLDELTELIDKPCDKNGYEKYIDNKHIESQKNEIFSFVESAQYKQIKNKSMREHLFMEELDRLIEMKIRTTYSSASSAKKESDLKNNIFIGTFIIIVILLLMILFYSAPQHEKTAQQEILMEGLVSIIAIIIASFK